VTCVSTQKGHNVKSRSNTISFGRVRESVNVDGAAGVIDDSVVVLLGFLTILKEIRIRMKGKRKKESWLVNFVVSVYAELMFFLSCCGVVYKVGEGWRDVTSIR